MRRLAPFLVPVLLLLLPPPIAAVRGGEDDDPKAYLAEVHGHHLDLTVRGLRSFSARLSLRRSEDENMRRAKDLAGFGYSFEAPETETFDFEETHKSLHKPLREGLGSLWRDLTGAVWFSLLEKSEDLALLRGDRFDVVSGTVENLGEVRASFESGGAALVELDLVKLTAKITYYYDKGPDGLRVACREVGVKGTRALRITYSVFREVSGFSLPTVLELESERNTTEYTVEYRTLNGAPALLKEPDVAEVKERVSEFEKGWRKWTESRKVREMRELGEVPHDLVSAAIAKHGLRDRSLEVLSETAEILGMLGRENVVPALIAAMKKNEREIEVYLRLIWALGEIGDPRAVDVLSKDWWNQRIGEYAIAAAKAKIRALGKIRHASSVDALIDTFYATKDETIARYAEDLVASLMKLTGQDFRYDRRAWKDWWKKNRARHRFD